jgi:hypothetical protein
MPNLFDNIEKTVMNTVTNTFGYDAIWKKQDGTEVTGRVLLNRPTQKATINDQDYDAISPKMEYTEGDFLGLFDRVRGNNSEEIWIGGYQHFAFKAERKFDGKTVIISLTPGEKQS